MTKPLILTVVAGLLACSFAQAETSKPASVQPYKPSTEAPQPMKTGSSAASGSPDAKLNPLSGKPQFPEFDLKAGELRAKSELERVRAEYAKNRTDVLKNELGQLQAEQAKMCFETDNKAPRCRKVAKASDDFDDFPVASPSKGKKKASKGAPAATFTPVASPAPVVVAPAVQPQAPVEPAKPMLAGVVNTGDGYRAIIQLGRNVVSVSQGSQTPVGVVDYVNESGVSIGGKFQAVATNGVGAPSQFMATSEDDPDLYKAKKQAWLQLLTRQGQAAGGSAQGINGASNGMMPPPPPQM